MTDDPRESLRLTQRLRALEEENRALRAREGPATLALETATDAIITSDARGIILTVNAATTRLFGYTKRELIGQPITRLMPERFRQAHQQRLAEYLRTGQRHLTWQGARFPGQHRDGHEIPLEISYSEYVREGQHVFVGILRDLSGRLQIEAELRASETTFRTIFNSVYDAILLHDSTGAILDVNNSMLTLYGVTCAEACRLRVEDFSAPDNPLEELPRRWQEVLAGQALFFPWRARRPHTGEVFDVEVYLCQLPLHGRTVIMANIRDVSARRRVEERLRTSEFFLRQVLDASPHVIFVLDREFRFLLANKAVVDFYQCPLEALLGYTQVELHRKLGMPMVEVEQWSADNRRALAGGPIEFIEFSHDRAGHGGWYRTRKIPLTLLDGTAALLVISENITDLKTTQEQLQRSNRTLRMLSSVNEVLVRATREEELLHDVCTAIVTAGGYRMAFVGFAEQDAERTVRPVAHAGHEEGYLRAVHFSWGENTYGCGPIGIAIRTRAPVMTDDVRTDPRMAYWREEALRRGYEAVIALPLLTDVEMPLGVLVLYRTERYTFTEEEVQLLSELAGDLAYGIVALRARQAHRHAEEALKRERSFLATAIDLLPFPILFVAPDSTVLRANRASQFIVQQLENHHWQELPLYAPETRTLIPLEQRPLARALHGEIVAATEGVVTTPEGVQLAVLVFAAPIRQNGELVAAVMALQDITALKEADWAKDQFLTILSHELKTPLTIIIGWGQLAQSDADLVPEALEVILRKAEEQRAMLDRLLTLSSILTGKLALQRKALELWAVVAQTAEELRPQAHARGVLLVLTPPAAPLPVRGDEKRLGQALRELLINGINYSDPGDTVLVTATRSAQAAILTVGDTGRGLAPGDLERIFNPFLQLQREERIGGYGVGLALARGIIEAHDGTITAASPGVGEGSIFTVTLPLVQELQCPA